VVDHVIEHAMTEYAQVSPVLRIESLAWASAHFPKFVLHRRDTFHELRKVMGTSKSMILVPLSI
jgi:hypothetical protein